MTIEYEVDNAQALNDLLDQIEIASTSAEFQSAHRDRGTRFETLSRQYFSYEPTYKDLFSKVQTFKEWAVEHPDLSANARDTGIDLVATLSDNSGYAAIQCKFYEKNKRVGKDEIDSFIAASNARHFTQRYIIATNDRWTYNVRAELASVFPAVILITREQLAESSIDWSSFLKTDTVKIRKPRVPFPYQEEAIHNVVEGFKTHDRGKLIMACGTGKTFTSMKIVERMEGQNGFVMFLVPSLALLSQTLTDWKQQCAFPINAYAVCSDSTTGKADLEEIDNLFKPSELNYPATTDAKTLAAKVNSSLAKGGLTVIFTTYQSIEVVSEAQKQYGMPEIGLAVCDEAHRTAGGYLVGNEEVKESAFLRIHDQDFIKAKKRLYMTATPKIFGKDAKKKEEDNEAVLYSMDDEEVFGPIFHQISFRRAVELGSLVDYKVIVLTVEDNVFGDALSYDALQNGGLSVSNAAKVVGCWRALSKRDLIDDAALKDDKEPMKRAVGFAQVIEQNASYDRVSSKQFAAQFQNTIENYKKRLHDEILERGGVIDEQTFEQEYGLTCETKHIDGSMDANEKGSLLNWLREDVDDDQCKILFNVRCLSEGVDVPALDAVMFLSPRKSQVDVVQTVGRVMRRSPKTNKKRGYVIIPIVTPADVEADLILNNNKDFDIVWQILRALRSIDPEFGAAVDGQLEKVNKDKIEVICLTEHLSKGKKSGPKGPRKPRGKGKGKGKGEDVGQQGTLDFGRNEILEEQLKARIVKKVGNVREWEEWAEEVGEICKTQINQINAILSDPAQTKASLAFDGFLSELKATINDSMNREEAVELIGQHIVTKPVIDALFEDYPFMDQNPISKALTEIVNVLDKQEMATSRKLLDDFYKAVKYRARNITTIQERQVVVRELFEKFFKHAFPKISDKLGIVYTPEEIVDFINQSVADILQKEFGISIADKGVHVLDPFTGTGTFLTRLMQSGLIPLDKLTHKFENELHANEIVPLAYYIASMNLEMAYHDLLPQTQYKPNNVTVWTDTFIDEHKKDLFKTSLVENNERLARLNAQDIRVIIGNPPYSVGQDSRDSDNSNNDYPKLFERIKTEYTLRSGRNGGKKSSRDSYKLAYRWASDRIGDKGVIGFVTNATWLDSVSDDGMRKCMAEEFNKIYIYNLRGGGVRRKGPEELKKEGQNVFNIMTEVAVVILIKNPGCSERGKIYYRAIDDYLNREQKLEQIKKSRSVADMTWELITPNEHGDWLNLREGTFNKFMRVDPKKGEDSIFKKISGGVVSSKDPWLYNSSKCVLKENVCKMINFFNSEVERYKDSCLNLKPKDLVEWVRKDLTQISWGGNGWLSSLKNGVKQAYDENLMMLAAYRPFNKRHYYSSKVFAHSLYSQSELFPAPASKNLVINITGVGSKQFCCLMADKIPSYDYVEKCQSLPLWLYQKTNSEDLFGLEDNQESKYHRYSAISEMALKHFREVYKESVITEEDLFFYIYGILHSKEYRIQYANNLIKELPRIPRVATYEQFQAFSNAGRKLAHFHVNYESVPEYEDVIIEMSPCPSFIVKEMKWGTTVGKNGKDKTRLIYNDDISISNIPLEAQEYVVDKYSALDTVIKRACVSTDKKGKSGIVNNINDYAAEMGDPRYPLSLFLRVITVSVETMKIVKALPKLEIHPMDK